MKDNFSAQSEGYARYRPVYPPQVYDFLLAHTTERRLAWDAGTGNGQIALRLAEKFERVHATDISAAQLEKADARPNIHYAVERAEACSLPDACAGLVTVAQAAHWFDLPAFYAEVRRVIRPGGLLALIGYGLPCSEDESVTQLIHDFDRHVIRDYWDPERRHIDEAYRSLEFPFQELPAPDCRIETTWTPGQLSGYLKTWSSVQHYIRTNGHDPVDKLDISAAWPKGEESVKVFFPIFFRAAKIF